MRYIFTLLLFVIVSSVSAQRIGFTYDISPTITVEGRALPNAWAGGLNACQFATLPLDADTRPDLIVLDRTTNRFTTFVATTGANNALFWQHAPQFEARLPAVENWFFLIDYDADGRKDLFAWAPSGAQVWRNTTTNGTLSWQLVTPSLQTDALGGNRSNVLVNRTDTPAIADFDSDGDVDVVAFDASGDRAVYYQNLSRQRTNPAAPAGLDFKTVASCWGQFRKNFCNDFTVEPDCTPGGRMGLPNGRPLHSGNTIRFFDVDGDGKQELVFGFVDCDNLSVLSNAGPANERAAFTRFEYSFPRLNPVRLSFPAAFFEDFDGDNVPDMVASPNVESNTARTLDFRASNWFYKNAGTSKTPDFQLRKTDFLQSDMLDLGDAAAPALADLDGDGDLDLLVGHAGTVGANGYRASLWQFENRGTSGNPAFVLLTKDYLGLTQSDSLTYLRPTFVDLDSNGAVDLALTASGKGGASLRVLLNAAPKGSAAQFNPATARRLTLSDGYSAGSPILFADIDADGKQDLLVSSFQLTYYRNTGTLTEPAFTLVTDKFGGLSGLTDYAISNASLALADLNGNRQNRLIMATRNGQWRVYQLPSQPTQTATLLDSLSMLQSPGRDAILTTGDLTGDGLPDLLIGSAGGGLRHARNTSEKVVPVLALERIGTWAFPNPTDRYVTVRPPYAGQLEVCGVDGRRVLQPVFVSGQTEQQFDLGTLPGGMYMLRLVAAEKPIQTCRLLLVR